jgi:hypothetical protein
MEEYLRLCNEKGWQNQLPKMKGSADSATASRSDTGPFGGKRVDVILSGVNPKP